MDSITIYTPTDSGEEVQIQFKCNECDTSLSLEVTKFAVISNHKVAIHLKCPSCAAKKQEFLRVVF